MPIRTGATCLLLAASLWLGSCRTPRPVPWVPPSTADCDALAPRITDKDRLRAMFSVHIYSYWSEEERPDGLEPMELEQASRILYCDRDPAAMSRRERAVAKLAAYKPHDRRALGIVRGLGADPERLLTPDPRDPDVGPIPFELEPSWLEAILLRHLRLVRFPWQPLCPRVENEHGWVSGVGPGATAHAELCVQLPLAKVARILDPQSWNQCSAFFELSPDSTYLVENDVRSCTHSVDSGAPAAGSAYGPRVFYEHFESTVSKAGVTTSLDFELLMSVVTWFTDPWPPAVGSGRRYSAHYVNDLQCAGSANGVPVTIVNDTGTIKATTDAGDGGCQAGWTYAYFPKTLSVQDPAKSGVIQAWLTNVEFSQHLRDMMCCRLP